MSDQSLRPKEDYLENLRKMRPNVRINGEVIARDHKAFMPAINCVSTTLELPMDPEHREMMTVKSHLTGKTITRYLHIHQSPQDLMAKQMMIRTNCRLAGGCMQRCMGMDALNAISVSTWEMDQALGTSYYQTYLEYMKEYQKNQWVGNCAQTDIKGDRKARPHEQPDPDVYLHCVERRKDGIVVRGCKTHIGIAPVTEELIVVPTRALTKEEDDWAVAFAIPADTKGVTILARFRHPRERLVVKAPIAETGDVVGMVLFDDVFVPWNRVFMCGAKKGEWEFGGRLALLFALNHRNSYCGCKPAMVDIIVGASALAAEYNGVGKSKHIEMKLAEMLSVAELTYAAGTASSVFGKVQPCGTCTPNPVYANIGRRHAGENIYSEDKGLAEISGGIPATLPTEKDFLDPYTGPLLKKYMKRAPNVSAEDQEKLWRLVADLTSSEYSGLLQYAHLHGGGSPVMEAIALLKEYDLEERKNVVRNLAGIKGEPVKPWRGAECRSL
ncbi:MAG: aromatic ring hydroxylase [Dehalococcoidia bacterium]|nr:aromatic ring hydroxylase [Dehalococcoidia bacterium]